MDKNGFIDRAIQLAIENVKSGRGGPFGAVVVKDGRIIASGTNQVTSTFDPTAHAEIVAIRNASHALGNFELTGCEIYCSCEPCPMCLGAIYWARPARVFFAATAGTASDAGFDDSFFKQQLARPYGEQEMSILQIVHPQASAPFEAWKAKADKIPY
jgi:guanine deaminase